MAEDFEPVVNGILWRNAYARLFARLVVENNPHARRAYADAISTMLDLRRARKERHANRR